MAFEVLLVLLAMLLTTETERSKQLSTRGRLCLCSDRVLRLSSPNSEASPFVSCKERCTTGNNAGVVSNVPSRHLRPRRELNILAQAKDCRYNKVAPGWHVKNISVTFHDIGNSSEWYALVSWNPFTESTHPWTGYYLLYSFGDNTDVNCSVIPENQTSVKITSTENKKKISLNVVALPKFKNFSDKFDGMILSEYSQSQPQPLGVIPPAFVPPTEENKITVTTYLSISIGILVGVALGAGLLKYFLCRKKSSDFPPEFDFHAFIIYQNGDSDWVSKELLPFLEEENNIKCCIHYKDFPPGQPFLDSMAESVYKSYKVIAVFSSNFLQSEYCRYELDLAQYRLLNKHDNSLIIIRIDKTDPNCLPRALQKRNFIDYADALERPFWKTRLLKFLKSGNEIVTLEQDQENNNSSLDDSIVINGSSQRRSGFDRLNSTTSNATEISIVTLNEER